ncbi:MAG: glycosyltransferase family 39 protein [Acidobacteriota bacterium]
MPINFVFHRQFAVERDGPLDAYRTPLFPLFAGTLYAIVGTKPWVALLAQAFIDTLTCLVLYLALRKHLDARIAGVASFFYALDPVLILYSRSTWPSPGSEGGGCWIG